MGVLGIPLPMSNLRPQTVLSGVLLAAILGVHLQAAQARDTNQDDLQSLVNGRNSDPPKSLVLNPKTIESRYRFAAGVSYTGLQLRYQFTPRWAAEARAQFGTAKSNYGDVKATVLGLRGYRFIPYRKNLSWYLGGEAAH